MELEEALEKVEVSIKEEREKLNNPCPNCRGDVLVFNKLFACRSCDFKIWKSKSEKELIKEEVEDLIKKGTTAELKGFRSKEGREFSAKLVLQDKVTGKVGFEFVNTKK